VAEARSYLSWVREPRGTAKQPDASNAY